ncbi:MAG: integrase/recombinase XerD [Thermoanaerobaculia bacterium]|jgi:site-specific recombinase XerD|nr:integrase/recombinase XerD [Thermoanaerobaculia bacterium]
MSDIFPIPRQNVRERAHWTITPPLPFQHESLEHLDARVSRALTYVDTVEGLSPTTVDWLRYAYSVFRAFLKECGEERSFLSGDARAQWRIADQWVASLRLRGKARSTINGYWRAMRMLCDRISRDDGAVNPFAFTKAPHPGHARLRCLTPEAAATVLLFAQNDDKAPPLLRSRNAAIVGVMVFAGLRRAEVLRLLVSDVDLLHRRIVVRAGKGQHGGKPRTVPMTPQLHAICADYAAARHDAGVGYPEFYVGSHVATPAREITVKRLFERISHATGVEVTPHMLRHTFCTLLSRAGIPDRLAREAMGHADFKTLQRYQHVYEGELADAMTKLALDV